MTQQELVNTRNFDLYSETFVDDFYLDLSLSHIILNQHNILICENSKIDAAEGNW